MIVIAKCSDDIEQVKKEWRLAKLGDSDQIQHEEETKLISQQVSKNSDTFKSEFQTEKILVEPSKDENVEKCFQEPEKLRVESLNLNLNNESISKSVEEDNISKIESSIKYKNFNDQCTGLECLANAATCVIMSEIEVKKDQAHTSTPNKPTKQTSPPGKKPKTIRQIYENENKQEIKEISKTQINDNQGKNNRYSLIDSKRKINQDDFEKGQDFYKKRHSSYLNKNTFTLSENNSRFNRTNYQLNENDIDENYDDEAFPSIIQYARRAQEKIKQKLLKQKKC